jgi:hypothetical protein
MAGLKGKSGPPGNMNAFKHGLAAIQKMARGRHSNRARGKRPNPFIAQCSPDLQSGGCFSEPQTFRTEQGNSQRPLFFERVEPLERVERFELGASSGYVMLTLRHRKI